MSIPPLWQHQAEDLAASREMPGAFFDWEPRVGKSRIAIETARLLYEAGKIDAVIIVAPSGVHLNWTRDQLPQYWPDPGHHVVEWFSEKASNGVKWYRAHCARAFSHPGLVWVAFNIETFMPKRNAVTFFERLARRRRCMLIVDESHYIKTPNAKRTRTLDRLSKLCPYRRCLTGTPVTQGPFDLFSQYRLLDRRVLGTKFATFKAKYGIFEKRYVRRNNKDHEFPELVQYRNLDQLRRRIAPLTFARRKADCLDLPERIIVPERFMLPEAHRRAYRQLTDEARAFVNGKKITARQVLVRLLRLQQASRGYLTDEDGKTHYLPGPYPAVERTIELVSQNIRTFQLHDPDAGPGKTIVWARFHADLDLLQPALSEALGGPGHVLRCDQHVTDAERVKLRERFRDDPSALVWLGTAATGGIGVDLGAANLMIWYSHGFNYGERLQALERNFGSTQEAARIDVVDLIAADTVDERAIELMEIKRRLAESVSTHGVERVLSGQHSGAEEPELDVDDLLGLLAPTPQQGA